MAQELRLSLLGNPRLRRDVAVTDLGSSKALALLAFLAVTGRPHLRSVLTGLLWADMPEPAARNNLSKALTLLRKMVGEHLSIDRREVAFDRSSPYWLDVERFQALVNRPAAATMSIETSIERLEEAVKLYRGDFLEGFYVREAPAFEEWVLTQRALVREVALGALQTLTTHHARRGPEGHVEALGHARRVLSLEPWREESHRQVMLLLAKSGQRGAALAQYETCRRTLAEELGVEPGSGTQALYERIRDGDVDPVALPSFLSALPTDDRPPSPFVDREGELVQLDGYLAEALAGQGRVVFVTGEAGTGKTTLVEEFARRVQVEYTSLVVAGGNCSAYTGVGDPYLPFREILGQLTGDVERRWAAGALSTEGARRLWRTMPLAIQSLLGVGPGLIDVLLAAPPLVARAAMAAPGGAGWRERLESSLASDKTDRRRSRPRPADLYAQVTALLSALAREHPLLLTLDDLHWADAGSIDLLFHLGRRLAGSRILIIGICRLSEVALGREDGRHPLAPLLHEFRRQFGAIEVDLPQAGGRRFVEAVLDSEANRLGAGFREALYQHTRGHALCTVEMLRDMQERGDLVQDEEGHWVEGPSVEWASLPARVEGAIGARIDRLPAALRETLKVASVEGEVFTAEVAARVRGVAGYEVVAQLSSELDRRHRLVASEGRGPVNLGERRASRYRFQHILFQAYVYGGLDEAERAYLHEAVGNALEQLYAGQVDAIAVQLARHYYAAARMDKAADYTLQAGDRALGLHAYAEARQHYARALDALARLPDTAENRGRRVDALVGRTVSSSGADSPEQNLARLADAEGVAQGLPDTDGRPGGDRLRLARVHLSMGRNYYTRGAYQACIGYYQQALSVARELGNAALIARSASAMGQTLASRGRMGRAEAMFSQVLTLQEKAGDRGERARALTLHGAVLAVLGDYAEGVAETQQAYAQLSELNALSEMTFGKILLSLVHRAAGDLPRAMEAAHQGVALAEQTGRQVSVYDSYLTLGWALCRSEQYDAAAAYAAKAETIKRDLGGQLVMADQLAALDAEITLGEGRLRDAIAMAKRAVGISQERKTIHCEGVARRTWGQALAALEPPEWYEAEDQLAQSLDLLEAGQSRLEAARTHVVWGTVCRDRGDLAAARAHWEHAAAQWDASGLAHELARTRALIGRLAQGADGGREATAQNLA